MAGAKTSDVAFRAVGETLRVPAVDRALNLIELLASSPRGLTLAEMSRKLHLPKSSAHYLVYTLASRSYIRRAIDGNHYVLGPSICSLPTVSGAELELRTGSMGILQEFAQRFDLTTTISVLRGAEAVILSRAKSSHDSGGGTWIGRHIDLHCTAQGKVLIAYLADEDLDHLLQGRELLSYTPNTILSLQELKAHLAVVRAQGYAVNDEENVIGIRAVGAPIFDKPGSVAAVVSARGTSAQIPHSGMAKLGNELIGLARSISLRLNGC
jgi:DNA-binding IclR family transcriptional regulator